MSTSTYQANVSTCNICESRDLSRAFELPLLDGPYREATMKMTRSFYKCKQCGHMSVDIYEPERYWEYYRNLNSQYHVLHDQDTWRYSRIAGLIPTTRVGRVLDIGCGTGTFLNLFSSSTERFGIEPCEHAAEQAKASGIRIVSFEDLHSSEIAESFDLVTAIDLVEHSKELSSLRKYLASALRPGGMLVVSTGDCESRTARMLGRYWYYQYYAEHLSFFSARSMSTWLQPEFEDIQIDSVSHHPLSAHEMVIWARIWLLFPAKWIVSKLPLPQPQMYPALWAQGDHMLITAVRRQQ